MIEVILTLIIIIILILLGRQLKMANYQYRTYKSSRHEHWCRALGTDANGTPLWHHSNSEAAKALRDIRRGPDSRKMDSLVFSRSPGNVDVIGDSGKQYTLILVDGHKSRILIKDKE